MLAPIPTATGPTFIMRTVERGERYGRDMCLTHDSDVPLVEFYDSRYPHEIDPDRNVLGQFVSRYSLTTLMEHGAGQGAGRGLNLDGGIPDWSLDAAALNRALATLGNWFPAYAAPAE